MLHRVPTSHVGSYGFPGRRIWKPSAEIFREVIVNRLVASAPIHLSMPQANGHVTTHIAFAMVFPRVNSMQVQRGPDRWTRMQF